MTRAARAKRQAPGLGLEAAAIVFTPTNSRGLGASRSNRAVLRLLQEVTCRSRLSTFVIDCKDADMEKAARFWGEALGRPVLAADPDSPQYRTLKMREDEPLVLLQWVQHDSRIHMDIETDDIDAEVARLEKLGAKRIEKVRTWWVMEAPTGQRFCVVAPQRGALDQHPSANVWDP